MPKTKGCGLRHTPYLLYPLWMVQTSKLRNYQGTSLRSPFFFLLLDSFLESLFCASPVFAASVAGASLLASVPVAAASLFAGVSAAPSAVGGFFAASSLVEGVAVVPAGAGAVPASLGCSLVAGALAAASLPAGATFSDVPVVSAAPFPPGDTVATIPVVAPPAPPRPVFPPGVSMSAGDIESVSGCRLGAPVLAAVISSVPGPFFNRASGFS